LWGSDWPHLRVTPEPQTEHLLDMFKRWVDSPAMVEHILRHNPEALYG
jgi:predicted TIM-barrel fold metal-dependent hydrolase